MKNKYLTIFVWLVSLFYIPTAVSLSINRELLNIKDKSNFSTTGDFVNYCFDTAEKLRKFSLGIKNNQYKNPVCEIFRGEKAFRKCVEVNKESIENLNKLALAVQTVQENCPHLQKAQEFQIGLGDFGKNPELIDPSVSQRIEYIKEKESSFIKDLKILGGRWRFYTSFLTELNSVQICGENLKSLSSKTALLRENLSRGTVVCEKINSQNQLKNCIEAKKGLLEKTKILAVEADDLEFHCSSVLKDFSAVSQLSSAIADMEMDLVSLNSDYDWIVSRRQMRQNLYEKQRYMGCELSILPYLSHIYNRELKIKTAGHFYDIYSFNTNFTALRVLNDYISAQARMCTADGKEPQTQQDKERLASIQSTVQKSQNTLDELNIRYADVVLEQWPRLKCEQLKNEHNRNLALCENPVDTPSWTYAVHQTLNNEIQAQAERESE